MTQAKAILIGAVITAVGAVIAALLVGFLGGASETNACRNEKQTVQNCGDDNEIIIGPSAPTATRTSEGDGAARN